MKKRLFSIFCFSFVLLVGSTVFAQKRNKLFLEYIDTYDELAVDQMKKYRIPASITLAQGLLESGAGQSTLAKKSNNHFGIKCGSSWRGKSVRHHDDALNECFRSYRNPKESYEDHSVFLTTGARYAFLFKLDITDYKAWAHGLKKAGYATNPSYANRLIQIIEDYDLYKYDTKAGRKKASSSAKSKAQLVPHQPYIANGLLYVKARRGDTFECISEEFDVSVRKLIKYNDLHRGYTLAQDDIVYLKAKKRRADKQYTIHIVRAGDSMHTISQMYGIQLNRLYKMNKKHPDEYTPQVGDRLKLR